MGWLDWLRERYFQSKPAEESEPSWPRSPEEVTARVLLLRDLPEHKRVLPPGEFGERIAALMPALAPLTSDEIRLLHPFCQAYHPKITLKECVAQRPQILPRLIEIVADRRVDLLWRASAAIGIGYGGTMSLHAVPILRAVLREFPTSECVRLDFKQVCLLFEVARALCLIRSQGREGLTEILDLFDDPRIKEADLGSCVFGSIVYRVHLLPELVVFGHGDERLIATIERSFYDEDGNLSTMAPQLLIYSGAEPDRVRSRLQEALSETYYAPERGIRAQPAFIRSADDIRDDFRCAVREALEELERGTTASRPG